MKTIAIKVFDKKEIISEVVATVKSDELTILQAQSGVNYEFLDETTGKAPDHIVAKRNGSDLLVSFEKEGNKAELMIENYYDYSDKQALIGRAESGSYYYYIPDTGEEQDHVGQLKAGEIEGQALGEESIDSPFWSGGWSFADLSFPDLGGIGLIKWLVIGAGIIAAVPLVRYVKDHIDDDGKEPIQRKPIQRKPIQRKPIQRKPIQRKPIQRKPILTKRLTH